MRIILISIITLLLLGCIVENPSGIKNPRHGIEKVQIEGMTCITYRVVNSGAITCNWEEWKEE